MTEELTIEDIRRMRTLLVKAEVCNRPIGDWEYIDGMIYVYGKDGKLDSIWHPKSFEQTTGIKIKGEL